MASTTPNIGLYKKDPVADANDYFNITTMLNDNWDALDSNQGSLAALRTALGLGATASIAAILTAMNTLISTAQSTADGRARIAKGSYTGTGTYGSDNPNSLAFSFAPKLVIIMADDGGYPGMGIIIPGVLAFCMSSESSGNGLSGYATTLSYLRMNTSIASNTVSWYRSSHGASEYGPRYQLNKSSQDYTYVAIG